MNHYLVTATGHQAAMEFQVQAESRAHAEAMVQRMFPECYLMTFKAQPDPARWHDAPGGAEKWGQPGEPAVALADVNPASLNIATSLRPAEAFRDGTYELLGHPGVYGTYKDGRRIAYTGRAGIPLALVVAQ